MDLLPNAPSCGLLCPRERYEMNKSGRGKVVTIGGDIYHVINGSYYVSDAKKEISNHFHSLVCRKQEEEGEVSDCLSCSIAIRDKIYYFCGSCKGNYHKVCVESPPIIKSSDHPKHFLQLVWCPLTSHKTCCFNCILWASYGNLLYSCFICDFVIHPPCVLNPTPYNIYHPKRHEHILHYFPRKSSLVCDVCGITEQIDYLYVCLLCDFIVHKICIALPSVIKISRHDVNHRLAFIPNIPYKEWNNCGVCHKKIDGNYGKYACMKGCDYAVHTKCALRDDLFDGKELEGERDEPYKNIIMFETEGDGIIRHSSHPDHQMRLEKTIQGGVKHCQMCTLSVVDHDGNVYRCMQCDFALHESCACMPSEKQFMLHAHPLFLKPKLFSNNWFQCWICDRYSCGFTYVCQQETCVSSMVVDTLCASMREPFDYHSHPHQLLLRENKTKATCAICKSHEFRTWSCHDCDFFVCFRCSTLPKKARYDHDDHLLTFFYEENANAEEVYRRCEICEEDINPKNGLYGCNECEVSLHIDCLRGRDPHVKPGESGILRADTIHILANTSTRPICKACDRRCLYKIKIESDQVSGPFCSFYCYQWWEYIASKFRK